MIRRCCCSDKQPPVLECQPCPTPWVAGQPVRHEVVVPTVTIHGDSTGSGALYAWTDLLVACMTGDCVRTQYRRKALFIHDFAPTCPEYADWCDNLVDDAGPTVTGGANYAWDGCNPGQELIEYEAGERVVTPEYIGTCFKLIEDINGCLQPVYDPLNVYPPSQLYSYVQVTYEWPGDTFTIDGLMDDCSVQDISATAATQIWVATYVRPIGAGEFYALGTYRLLNCFYPGAEYTVGVDNFGTPRKCCTAPMPACADPGGYVCGGGYNTPWPGGPSTWQVPEEIQVLRIN